MVFHCCKVFTRHTLIIMHSLTNSILNVVPSTVEFTLSLVPYTNDLCTVMINIIINVLLLLLLLLHHQQVNNKEMYGYSIRHGPDELSHVTIIACQY